VIPRVVAKLFRVVAEAVGGRGAGTGGPLPLGLGGQPVILARLGRQPAAVFHGGVVGDAKDRVALAAVAGGLVGVGLGRAGKGVGVGLQLLLDDLRRIDRLLLAVAVVLVPGDLAFTHPEGLDSNRVLRALVVLATRLVRRAAHQVRAAGDRYHLELN